MLSPMSPLRLDVWSDIACPWCYVGKRRLEKALADFPHPVTVVYHAFELDPAAPQERDPTVPHVERLARKYGMSVAQAKMANDRLTEVARGEGLAFDFERIRSGNTFDSHRLVRLALERGLQAEMKERLMRAYLEEGQLMSDHATLTRLAKEVGLDEAEVTDVLSGDRYAIEVRRDEAEAAELGIGGVPCYVFDRSFGFAGAQSPQVMLSALNQAWSERDPDEGGATAPGGRS